MLSLYGLVYNKTMRLRVFLGGLFIFLFAFFVLHAMVTQDPDFGWHIQFGRLITTTGTIPLTDQYSYTMPSYHFVDHEWGMDVLLAFFYDRFGRWPLIIGFSLIGVCTLLVISIGTNLRWVA